MARMIPLADSSGERDAARSAAGGSTVVSKRGTVPSDPIASHDFDLPSGGKARFCWPDMRIRVVVVDDTQETRRCPDRLDEEFKVVARLPPSEDLAYLHMVLALARPKLMLLKSPLDKVDYRVVELCRDHRMGVLVLARPIYGLLGSHWPHRFGGLPWLQLNGHRKLVRAITKRIFDILWVVIWAPVILPLMVLIGLAICRDGPPLYFQHRVGKGGRVFRLIKFRTMCVGAERGTGPTLASENDPRITRIGRFLRRYRLDELPQLWNVLRGDMSLVGPRPERPVFVDQFRNLPHIPHYDLRHLIPPGITGIGQLTGGYRASVEESLQCDLLYASSQSLCLDMKLVGLTLIDILRGFPRG